MNLNDQAVIITGGASGMGAAIAQHFAALGANIALLDLNLEAASRLANTLHAKAYACDVTDEASVQSALELAAVAHGPARILINCAGVLHSRRMVNQQGPMPLDEFQRVLTINVVGTFNVMRLAAANMIPLAPLGDGERGVIINIASIAAYEGQIGQTAYSASKGAIVSMVLPAARELAAFGIRVLGIAPGLVDTPMFSSLSPDARTTLSAAVPFPKRLAEPKEIAALAAHLVNNVMMNGEVVRIDGAIRLQAK